MPLITSIKLQKNKKRANIYLDGKFSFSVDNFNLLKFGLKEGREISDKEVVRIIKEGEGERIWERLLKFVSFRQRTEKEVIDWFERKKTPFIIGKKYLSKLKKLNLLDDTRFAHSFVEDRLSFNPKPKRVLLLELIKKGVSKDTAEEVLNDFEFDEESQIKNLLLKHQNRWKNLEPRAAKQKKARFLVGKGYSWELVRKIVFDGEV